MFRLFVAALLAAPALAADPPAKLVAHEWGTFTSFSGSDGTCVGFSPDNSALPPFVYRQHGLMSKDGRLLRGGTVSLETPVIYFYTDRETKLTARVDFPKGWVTEWFPQAQLSREPDPLDEGKACTWDVILDPKGTPDYPRRADNVYYRARETDAVPLRRAVAVDGGRGTATQWEKFLFYRGVGTFSPPVTVRALGGGKVKVTNTSAGPVGGLILLTVGGGKIGYRPLPDLAAGRDAAGEIPTATATPAALMEILVKKLTAAGLYPKEAAAMVRTWEGAWFGEDGTRLMYLVPRTQTDAILKLTIEPKPAEIERVLVGRHDFLTPEREAEAVRQVRAARAAGNPLGEDDRELVGFGRFAPQARAIAAKR